jgi:hypothetical protein
VKSPRRKDAQSFSHPSWNANQAVFAPLTSRQFSLPRMWMITASEVGSGGTLEKLFKRHHESLNIF